MKPTSKEIAEICGVSRGTVDRALNNRPGIKAETREKILKVAEEFGYRPDFLARSLVKGKTMTLGLVIFDINNRIFAQLIHAIEEKARQSGYFVYLTLTNKDANLERQYLNQLADRKIDGLALLSVNKGKPFEQFLKELNIPVVTFGNRISEYFPHVWINDYQAIKDAVHYIAEKEYKEIIYISPPLSMMGKANLSGPEQRYLGFVESCRELEAITYTVINHKNYLYELDLLLRNLTKKTAILCSSDKYAMNVLKDLQEKGWKVPEEIGVMGFDNIDVLQYITPSLSTIDFSVKAIGAAVVDNLIALIQGEEPPFTDSQNHTIISRDSL